MHSFVDYLPKLIEERLKLFEVLFWKGDEEKIITRVIDFLLRDVASLTKFHMDLSKRLCYLLGAREAIMLMLAVKEAPKYIYIMPNVPPKEKSIDKVKGKIIKDLNKQGYEYLEVNYLKDIIAVSISDRKKEIPATQEVEELANKYVLEEIKQKGYPQVILRRQASISASLGSNITSGDITTLPPINPGDEVVLMDIHYDIVGYGIANMSSEEIKRSPGRIAIRTLEGRYDVLKYRDNKHYVNGLYSITTLPRVIAKQLLSFDSKKAFIMIICQDNGEIAAELLRRAPNGSEIHLITRNDNHRKAIKSTFERLVVDQTKVTVLSSTLDRFSKSRPRVKFTHFYIEVASSDSGLRPNPYFDLEEKNIISNARTQFSALRSASLIGDKNAEIIYVTHSLDPTENEEVVVQAYRQGNIVPIDLPEEITKIYESHINALPEIPTVTQSGSIDLNKMDEEEIYIKSWINTHPIINGSDAGFIAKMRLK